ncbi:hypothetical protein TIFTF001_038250 [Ficus carica]|uniref:Uncharacterized protein n=1 Tax=Ficus carica TaxID=3494 RepID=A0AA88E6X9_FICCA|nr:hypothetical protein TIFTF001_038250 [Ficus carica]
MPEIHHDLIISYRKLSLSTMLPLRNFDPLAVMAPKLIRISAPSCNIADVSSHVHILVPYAKAPCTSLPDQASAGKYNLKICPYMT